MTSGMTPLSLAYLIEISFVINLAYHELNTFKLRDQINDKSKKVLDTHKGMDTWDGDATLFEPEWSQLKNLSKGIDKDGWEHKKRRFFYHYLISSGWDRALVRILLALDVIVLVICTLYADINIDPYSPINAINISILCWWLGFIFLVLSIMIPALLMWLGRCCKQYIFGFVEEEDSDGKTGRLHDLNQIVLRKITARINVITNNGIRPD